MPSLRDHTEARRYLKTEEERVELRRRRAEASWHDWLLTEFLRYVYALGGLAAIVFVPLQMADSWLRPPVSPTQPAAVAVAIVAFEATALYVALRGYTYLWGRGGWIDRHLDHVPDEDRESL